MRRFMVPLLLLSSLPVLAQYTIRDVLSAPYCSGLVSAPQTDRIAWVTNEEGIRNIQTHRFSDSKTLQLTQYSSDDGQDLTELQLSPDGSLLTYVRGGGKNGEGVSPNPTSDPAGAEQTVFVVPTDGSAPPIRIGPGSRPQFSPDGKKLLFSQGGQLHVADLTNKQTNTAAADRQTTKLFSARGRQGEARWSPDGQKVVFTSFRGYHNFIGVFDLARQKITWLAPGVDRDQLPVWSPDGRKVAFIRVPGQRHGELENIMGGQPFEIWEANVDTADVDTGDMHTGECRRLFGSPADDGGFAQYYPAEPLRWTASNRIVFFSEHDGWMHLYALDPTQNKAPVLLTPGEFEVEETAVSPDGRFLYYSSNNPQFDPADRDRRHLWRVDLTTGRNEAMTRGTGIETDPTLAGDYLVYRSASWNRSTGIAARRLSDKKETAIYPVKAPDRFPATALVEPKAVVFKAPDGLDIHAQLFLPAGSQRPNQKRPCVIFLHGGPIRQMLLGWHYRGSYYANAYAMNQYLASQGYVVLSVNFRTGIGYGKAFRRAEKQGPRGASEYQDVLAAARYLQSRPDVDPLKIGLWGGSYGGYLTALALARNSDLFACGVDLHGVHDWSWRGNFFSPGGGWGIGEKEAKTAFESSPNFNLDFWRSPCLFVHADDDRNVTFAETVDLVQKLRQRRVPVEVLVFPDDVHSFLLHRNWLHTYESVDQFLKKHLSAKPLTISNNPSK